MADVLIAGSGPAGLALAAASRLRGLSVALADPLVGRPWRATYGMWLSQWEDACASLPILGDVEVRRTERPLIIAPSTRPDPGNRGDVRRALPEPYVVCSTESLHRVLWDAAQPMTTSTAPLSTADLLAAARESDTGGGRRVIDARGALPPDLRQRGSWTPESTPAQSAYGLSFDDAALAPLLTESDGTLMDWRQPTRPADEPAHFAGRPSFLYLVRLPGGHTLAEETDLAGAPSLPLKVLRRRLETRLEAAGVAADKDASVHGQEKVHFPLVAAPRPRRLECFGTAAGFGHPATGYSVATALQHAAAAAAALESGRPLPRPVRRGTAAAHAVGLRALLALPDTHTLEMFAGFARLAGRRQQAFFERTAGPGATIAAMAEQWWRTPARTRWAVLAAVARHPLIELRAKS